MANDFKSFFATAGDEEGIVHVLVCSNCGAVITYEVPVDDSEGE